MPVLSFVYHKIMLNPVVLSLISGFVGAIVGGFATYKATDKAHKNNIILEEKKIKKEERNVILSIAEELRVLKETYQEDMDEYFKDYIKDSYLDGYYTVTQDFTTIYSNNASKIGLITDIKPRNLIIKTYTNLKKFIEELLLYKDILIEFENNRNNFIARVYQNCIISECSKANTKVEIDIIYEFINKNDWSWLKDKTSYINENQVITFMQSDRRFLEILTNHSAELRQEYKKLKELIEQITTTVDNIYKEQ